MANRLDEKAEKAVDWLCRVVPAAGRKLYARMACNRLGWHILLTVTSVAGFLGAAAGNLRTEEALDRMMSGTYAGFMDRLLALRLTEEGGFLDRLRRFAESAGLRFCALLFITALSAAGLALSPGREMAALALSALFAWTGEAMILSYRPVAGGLRQTYLWGRLMRALSSTALLVSWFLLYRGQGIASNVLLQSAMLISMGLHLAVYLAAIAFSRRQHWFLRVLDGALGLLPALAMSAAFALLPSALGHGGGGGAALLRALGAAMLFAADRLEAVAEIGLMPVRGERLITALATAAGYYLLLQAVWTPAF